MFEGSMVALVTPMTADGVIDYFSLEELLEFHVEEDTSALVVGGTTGESATLKPGELEELVGEVGRIIRGRMPVIAGAGRSSTGGTIEFAKTAQRGGANACLIVTPAYNKPTQDGLYQHYTMVADELDIPVILYNVPGRTACDLLPQTVARLARHPNIIGIKEATPDPARGAEILKLCGDAFELYSGDDPTALQLLELGAKGVISVTANVVPGLMSKMCQAALAGDKDTASRFDAQLQPLHKALFVESNPIPVKWALTQMGLIPDGLRLPMTPLADPHHAVVADALESVGLELRAKAS